jgi:hypothetical protein
LSAKSFTFAGFGSKRGSFGANDLNFQQRKCAREQAAYINALLRCCPDAGSAGVRSAFSSLVAVSNSGNGWSSLENRHPRVINLS